MVLGLCRASFTRSFVGIKDQYLITPLLLAFKARVSNRSVIRRHDIVPGFSKSIRLGITAKLIADDR